MFLPVGHDDTTLSRPPVVTFVVIGVCTVAWLLTLFWTKGSSDPIGALLAAHEMYTAYGDELEVPDSMLPLADAIGTWLFPVGIKQMSLAPWSFPVGIKQMPLAPWSFPVGIKQMSLASWSFPVGIKQMSLPQNPFPVGIGRLSLP